MSVPGYASFVLGLSTKYDVKHKICEVHVTTQLEFLL